MEKVKKDWENSENRETRKAQEGKGFFGLATCIVIQNSCVFNLVLCSHPFTHHLIITRIPSTVCNVDLHLFTYKNCCFNNFILQICLVGHCI